MEVQRWFRKKKHQWERSMTERDNWPTIRRRLLNASFLVCLIPPAASLFAVKTGNTKATALHFYIAAVVPLSKFYNENITNCTAFRVPSNTAPSLIASPKYRR